MQNATKNYTDTIHSTSKLTTVKVSRKKNVSIAEENLKDKRNKQEPEYEIGDFVRTAYKNVSCECDPTNWSYDFYRRTEVINDTIPTYHIEFQLRDKMKPYWKRQQYE